MASTLPTYTPDWSYMTDAFKNTYILGSGWILPLIMTFIVIIMITRDINKWKILMFPFLVLWNIIGIPVNLVIMIFAGLVFVIEALSTEMGGNLLTSITEKITPRTIGGTKRIGMFGAKRIESMYINRKEKKKREKDRYIPAKSSTTAGLEWLFKRK